MKLLSIVSLVVAASATVIPRQSCSEADRYGVIKPAPTSVTTGVSFTISTDFTCAEVKNRWLVVGADYFVRSAAAVPSTGEVEEYLLTHRTLPEGALSDSFETTLKFDAPLNQTENSGVAWNLVLRTTYGNPTTWGEIWYPVTIAN